MPTPVHRPASGKGIGSGMHRMMALAALLMTLGCERDPGRAPDIRVRDAWTRPTVAPQSSAAVYATIENRGGEDRLIGARTEAAAAATLHRTTNDDGVARMRPATDGFAVDAGEQLLLTPGGAHIMLTGLRRPLAEGEQAELIFQFARSGAIPVTLRVADAAVGAGQSDEGH